jgi:hypothetical protein
VKFLQFIVSTFADKEGSTRATATAGSVLAIVLYFFVPRTEYVQMKAQTDTQQRLLWGEIAVLKNVCQDHGWKVPGLVGIPTVTFNTNNYGTSK